MAGNPMRVENSPAPVRPRILVVEDEVLICLLIETMLSDADYDVLVANTLSEAVDIIDAEKIDLALLDLNIKGQKVYPIAEKLAAINIPFIFATGGGIADVEGFAGRPTVGKPFQEGEIVKAVARLLPVR